MCARKNVPSCDVIVPSCDATLGGVLVISMGFPTFAADLKNRTNMTMIEKEKTQQNKAPRWILYLKALAMRVADFTRRICQRIHQ